MHNIYLFQPQYTVEVRKEKNYWIPYSAGCIWSYAAQYQDIVKNFELKEIIFKREFHSDIINRMVDPKICGFSCYIWNYQYCLMLAEKIKNWWPKCKIIFGGAQSHSSLLNKKFIDCLVFAEGEEAFVDILRRYQTNQELETIYTKSRVNNLDIPSPYLTGIFDNLVKDNPDAVWAATIETTRGCPYHCTFCDTGQNIYNKVKKFDTLRVAQELKWMSKNNIAYLMTADANFGIFKERDLEIAKLIRKAADVPGSKIESMNVNFAKNSSETIFELGQILGSLLRGGITFSLQSTNKATLEDVHRINMEINKMSTLLSLGEKYGVLTYTEMIIGLPNETQESWKNGITELLEMGQHQNIDVWFSQLLLNSEMSQPESRKKYKLSTIHARDYITLENSAMYDECPEYVEIINSTATMTTDELIDAYMYSWMIIHFHITGYSQVIARYCYSIEKISYRKYYDILYEKIKQDSILSSHYNEVKNTVSTYLKTGVLINSDQFKGHTIHGMSYKFLYDYKNLITIIAVGTANEVIQLPDNIGILQENFIFDTTHIFPRQLLSEINLETWTKESTLYSIENTASNDTFDFYFHRRKNLLKNKFHRIQ